MIECKYLQEAKCLRASLMANLPVVTTEKACTVCLEQSDRTNHVTASLALNVLTRPVPQDKQYLYGLLKRENIEVISEGPGTELKKLISWFVWSTSCNTCQSREQRMNKWGPDVCEKNILTITEWLHESAKKKGYPFSHRIASALIRKAISNSRKK